MTDRRPTLTDREAIRRLAVLIGDLAHGIQLMGLCDEARELARSIDDLAEPAVPTDPAVRERIWREMTGRSPVVPTVTREQAIAVRYAVGRWIIERGARYGIHIHATEAEMPAFFRAVADRLEGK